MSMGYFMIPMLGLPLNIVSGFRLSGGTICLDPDITLRKRQPLAATNRMPLAKTASVNQGDREVRGIESHELRLHQTKHQQTRNIQDFINIRQHLGQPWHKINNSMNFSGVL